MLLPALLLLAAAPGTFVPSHKVSAIGAARADMTDELLAIRTERMIDAQTFGILRDPRALAGAQRIMSPKMQQIFEDAARRSGLSPTLIAAIAYLESWGDSSARSPTGPKGAMQISGGTARSMGLKVTYATRYKVTTAKKRVKLKSGKTVVRTVTHKTPYRVLVSDERTNPARAIPAAAAYLARMQNKFGGLDWAIFAYHCGEGCVGSMRAMTEQAKGLKPPYTVAKMFFGATPAFNRDLYEGLKSEMERDFSPTYWFRIMRAQQLLALYKSDPAEFKRLAADYRYDQDPAKRAPHRLAVWLRASDFRYQSPEDIKRDEGVNLVRPVDDPAFFGFRIRNDNDELMQASPAAIGTLVYVAYETRRLFESMRPREKFVPLDVTSLVRTLGESSGARLEALAHESGQVFDIDYRSLPLAERDALDFVLRDLGWEGYVGFVEEAPHSGTLHIGCAPAARDFFSEIFEEARAARP